MEGGMGVMCNISDYIEERSYEVGKEIGKTLAMEKNKTECLNLLVGFYLEKRVSYNSAVKIAVKHLESNREEFDKLVTSRSVCV